jgi:hypothetical protein
VRLSEELLPNEKQEEIDELGKSASRLVGGLITYLNSCGHRGRKFLNTPESSRRRIKRSEHRRRRPPNQNRKPKTENR